MAVTKKNSWKIGMHHLVHNAPSRGSCMERFKARGRVTTKQYKNKQRKCVYDDMEEWGALAGLEECVSRMNIDKQLSSSHSCYSECNITKSYNQW